MINVLRRLIPGQRTKDEAPDALLPIAQRDPGAHIRAARRQAYRYGFQITQLPESSPERLAIEQAWQTFIRQFNSASMDTEIVGGYIQMQYDAGVRDAQGNLLV